LIKPANKVYGLFKSSLEEESALKEGYSHGLCEFIFVDNQRISVLGGIFFHEIIFKSTETPNGISIALQDHSFVQPDESFRVVWIKRGFPHFNGFVSSWLKESVKFFQLSFTTFNFK
jgi:hypothetical protein